jgi:hypothetical protein
MMTLLQLPNANQIGTSTLWPLLAQAVQQHDRNLTGLLCQHAAALQAPMQGVADLAEQALRHTDGAEGV